MAPRAVIFGCQGPVLSSWERAFFTEADPLGFIVFLRNCETPQQLRDLTASLRACVGRDDAPVLIDQEGGPVTRLRPPQWRACPAPARFGTLAARDRALGLEAVRLNTALIAGELRDLGITVDCLPLLDLPVPDTSAAVGERSFSADLATLVALASVQCEGFLAGGVLPVIKHIPGHGRATVDSHHHLPRIEAPRAELEASDFAAFRALAGAPLAMTGHVVYEAIDADAPATTSPRIIAEVIRGFIGFDGLLLSDDLSMEALEGGLGERASRALAAGCDVALHCNGRPEEMQAVAAACGELSEAAGARLARAEAARRRQASAEVGEAAEARLAELLALV